jgi:hypothetical protein
MTMATSRTPDHASRPLPLGLTRDLRYRVGGAAAIVLSIFIAMAVRSTPFEGESVTATQDSASSTRAPRPAAARGSARELRTRLTKQVKSGKYGDAASTLDALLAADPRAPEDEGVSRDINELASRSPDDAADTVFRLIATKMGTAGPDLLYEMYTARGGSKSAERAKAVLADESVRKRGTPAMRVAYDLVRAKGCKEKGALIERAGEEGDERALGRLRRVARECDLQDDEKLDEAMKAISDRIR